MLQTEIVNNKTTLFVSDSGGYFTICHPTNFHQFYTRKTLAAGERPEYFMEVTAAEKAKLEAQDAAWVEPPRLFIEQWNEAAGAYGRYNPETGYFELNGIVDITYTEALKIYRLTASFPELQETTAMTQGLQSNAKLRTAFPFRTAISANLRQFLYMTSIEVVAFTHYYSDGVHVTNLRQAFSGTKRIITPLVVSGISTAATEGFYSMASQNLEFILLKGLKINLPFRNFPKIEQYCLKYIIDNALNTEGITITVHPDVFAKLTGDTSNAAAATLSEEELQQWMALPDLAAEKKLTFVTT